MAASISIDFTKSFDATCMTHQLIRKCNVKINVKIKKRRKGNTYDKGIDNLWTRGQLMAINKKYSSSIVSKINNVQNNLEK